MGTHPNPKGTLLLSFSIELYHYLFFFASTNVSLPFSSFNVDRLAIFKINIFPLVNQSTKKIVTVGSLGP